MHKKFDGATRAQIAPAAPIDKFEGVSALPAGPGPVLSEKEPNPKFFIGTGDGSSGSYEEPQHR